MPMVSGETTLLALHIHHPETFEEMGDELVAQVFTPEVEATLMRLSEQIDERMRAMLAEPGPWPGGKLKRIK